MKKFIAVKIVEAKAMTAEEASKILDRPVDTSNANENGDGYLVRYKDGYTSWCPEQQFEDANRPCENMTFGMAIEAAKQGNKVARRKWNGKNMFIVYMPPIYLPPFNTQGTFRKVNDRTAKWIGEDKPLDCQPYFAMYNAQEQWIPGWVASQSDMLDEDWYIVD